MLPGIMSLAGFAGGGASGVVEYVSAGFTTDTADLTTYTLAGVDLGAAASDRRIFVVIHSLGPSIVMTLNSGSIGGVGASIVKQETTSVTGIGHGGIAFGIHTSVMTAAVPTGATGTVSLTFNAAASGVAIAVFRATGMSRTTAFDTLSVENTDPSANLSGGIDVEAGGFVIAATVDSDISESVSWTGVTEQYDATGVGGSVRISLAWSSNLSAETNRTITAAVGGASDESNNLVAISWS